MIHSLSVVIPAFNEELIIEKSIIALSDVLQKICRDYEILVVDDGSNDATAYILAQLRSRIRSLLIIQNPRNRGLGNALRNGFSAASKDLVLYMDADMPFEYSNIMRAVERMDGCNADFVAGFRISRRQESVARRLSSTVYNAFVSMMYGVSVRDINCAFKLMKTNMLKRLDLKANGSFIDAEIVIKACYGGFRIHEMGVFYFPRRETCSRLFQPYPILNGFREFLKFYCNIRRNRYCVRHGLACGDN